MAKVGDKDKFMLSIQPLLLHAHLSRCCCCVWKMIWKLMKLNKWNSLLIAHKWKIVMCDVAEGEFFNPGTFEFLILESARFSSFQSERNQICKWFFAISEAISRRADGEFYAFLLLSWRCNRKNGKSIHWFFSLA